MSKKFEYQEWPDGTKSSSYQIFYPMRLKEFEAMNMAEENDNPTREQRLLAKLRKTVCNLERVAEESERASKRARGALEAFELEMESSTDE